jgi:hypothetical protein
MIKRQQFLSGNTESLSKAKFRKPIPATHLKEVAHLEPTQCEKSLK